LIAKEFPAEFEVFEIAVLLPFRTGVEVVVVRAVEPFSCLGGDCPGDPVNLRRAEERLGAGRM
jgi:hypothetical protein